MLPATDHDRTFLGPVARRRSPSQHEVSFALALEFGDLDLHQFDVHLDRLAADIAGARGGHSGEQLAALGRGLSRQLTVVADEEAVVADLRLDDVVRARRGHELAAAMVAVEVAARLGTRLAIVASPERIVLAMPTHPQPDVLVPSAGWALTDARSLEDEALAWACPHTVASLWLETVDRIALAAGDRETAVQSVEAQLDLPWPAARRRQLLRRLATLERRLS